MTKRRSATIRKKPWNEHGVTGNYLQAIQESFAPKPGLPLGFASLYADVQLALAYQHAGMYHVSLRIYRGILARIPEPTSDAAFPDHPGLRWRDLSYNLRLQEIVLLERLEQLKEAGELFDKLEKPSEYRDIGVAKSTLLGWHFTTHIRIALSRAAYSQLKQIASDPIASEDDFTKLWAEFALALDRVLNRGHDLAILRRLNAKFYDLDPPGHPWFLLLEGIHLRQKHLSFSTEMFLDALVAGRRLGRFFIIGAASEGLVTNLRGSKGNLPEVRRHLLSALRSYQQCQLLSDNPFRSRLYGLSRQLLGWTKEDFSNVYLRTLGVLRPRAALQIGRMCSKQARKDSTTTDQVFEKFIEEWATLSYPGWVCQTHRGAPAVDVVCKRRINGKWFAVLIQAKLYSSPRRSIPAAFPLIHNFAREHHIDVIEEYCFVVAKKGMKKWTNEDWHHEDDNKIRNLIPPPTRVVVVTEPMLQTDIITMHQLQSYFD